MATMILNKNYTAQGAIGAFRIVKWGTADDTVTLATAETDALVGVCESVGPADGERCDIARVGIPDVLYGGTVTRGDPLTSDDEGRAVLADPDAGDNARIVGFAEVSAVEGDIAPMLLAPGVMQG